jgi:hypothetical protein
MGVQVVDSPLSTTLDYFLGVANAGAGDVGPVRATVADVAAQLSSSGPIAQRLELLEDAQASGVVLFDTWAALAAHPGSSDGDRAEVRGDGGTHTDPVSGATDVPNSGIYSWQTSPAAGWLRVDDVPPTAADVDADVEAMRSVGASAGDFVSTTYGVATPGVSVADAGFIWGPAAVNQVDGWMTSASIHVSAAGSGAFVIVDQSGKVLSETATPVALGANAIIFDPPVYMPAGAWLFWKPGSGEHLTYGTAGSAAAFTTSSYPGVGFFVAPAIVGSVRMAFSYTVKSVAQTMRQELSSAALRVSDIALQVSPGARTCQPSYGFWSSALSIDRAAIAADVGVDIAPGAVISAVTADVLAYVGTDHFIVSVYERETTSAYIDSNPPVPFASEETLLQTIYAAPSDIGLTVGASASKSVDIPIRPFRAVSGRTYVVAISAHNSSGGLVVFGIGNSLFPDARPRARGWYHHGVLWSTVAAGYQASLGFVVDTPKIAAREASAVIERFNHAYAEISGLSITVSAQYESVGHSKFVGETRTLTAAASGKTRYDLLYYNPATQSFGVDAGAERTTDACEFLPAPAASTRLPLFHVRVTDAAISDVVPLWNIDRSGVAIQIEASLEQERRRSRYCLRRTISKVRKGAAIKVVSIGDSIVAIQSAPPSGGTATPNGPERDRGTSYLANVGADVIAAIPLYTSVALGRADDGAGAVHTKFGLVWEFVGALQALGNSVSYDNFGIGGKATADALTGGAPNAWVTNAIALGPDIVIMHFGMNELANTSTEANLVTIGAAFIAAGIEVVMMGVPLYNPAFSTQRRGWYYTNRAIARAAKHVGAAHVPTVGIYDPPYIGAIGISALDASSANAYNHPGIVEHRAIGREIAKLLIS